MPQRYLYMIITILSLILINISINPKKIDTISEKPIIISTIKDDAPIVPPIVPENKTPENKTPTDKKEPKKEKTPIYAKDMQDALDKAKKENRKILLFFHTSWCPGCNKMLSYFPNKDVEKALSDYVILKVNTEVDRALAKKYNIYFIPRYIQLNADGKILKDNTGEITQIQFISWLR